MNAKHLIAAAVAAVGLSSAFAQEATPDTWINAATSTKTRAQVVQETQVARANGELDNQRQYDVVDRNFKPTLSRAEVLADLALWKRSGMAALDRGEASPSPASPEYRAAHARYVALRNSPEYTALVKEIAGQRGEVLAGQPEAANVR